MKSKVIIVIVLTACRLICEAQVKKETAGDEGIEFIKGMSWAQVLIKAKAEKKYIFLDCYATWCEPCRLMDKSIYPLKEVGDYFNAHFISV